jgi:3-hydroxyisobutyrate dehydrogenase-like beta-hydroxyacid dehydrogenase
MARQNPVGVVGVGLMGEVFARRLIAAGFAVVGFDVDPAKTARLAEFGGRPAASIAELARAADPIVLAVFDTDQVEQVVEKDLLPALGAAPRQAVLCTSTCDPDRIAALAERVRKQGLKFLETPG